MNKTKNDILETALIKLDRIAFLFKAISVDNNELEGLLSEPIDHLAMLGLDDTNSLKRELESYML